MMDRNSWWMALWQHPRNVRERAHRDRYQMCCCARRGTGAIDAFWKNNTYARDAKKIRGTSLIAYSILLLALFEMGE